MNFGLQIQKQNYDELCLKYREIEKIAVDLLRKELKKSKINVMQLPHRIKTWESVEGKMSEKQNKYSRIEELTDILGIRVICYFLSQVDEAAKIVGRLFEIDRENSSDKREEISPDSFGYISLHMICTLRKDMGYPKELTDLKFEVQLKTILQHAWAEIEHDLGYKTPLEIPNSMRRNFARIAGLLEVADDYFENLKNNLEEYEINTLGNIKKDIADDMTIDRLTLNAYVEYSSVMKKFYKDMLKITGGKVIIVGAEDYLQMLSSLNLKTLGDIHQLIIDEHDHALELLKHALLFSDLENITSNAALFYLCRAKVIWGDYTQKDIKDIFRNAIEDFKKADQHTETILGLREEMKVKKDEDTIH
ncbi:GTP pyrophosphokinase [Butyrivibrio sp. AE3004]|uniref:GTP pyrophosphokinase n=1 Tax=Butyrivibrio sp. AE3004 TaxID=1506994 RepID=UPI00068B6654|nr:hypothetical protein [Butyrivibrio sp. AE3004]